MVELTMKMTDGKGHHDLRHWDFSHQWFDTWIQRNYLDYDCDSLWQWSDDHEATIVAEYVAQPLREKAAEINATLEITLSGMTMRFENEHDYLQAVLMS